MKTDGTPLHGSYFELATAKYPDLKRPASGRRLRLMRRHGGRFGVLPVVLSGALAGVVWLALALKPEVAVSRLPASGGTLATVAAKDLPAPEPARRSTAIVEDALAVSEAEVREAPRPVAGEVARPPPDPPRQAVSSLPEQTPESRAPTAATRSEEAPAARPLRADVETPNPGAAVATSVTPPPIVPARKIFAPFPEYPPDARRTGEQGTVVVDAEVDASGAVTGTTIVRGHSPALDAAAAAALESWRFEPARRGDVAVESTYRIGIKFTLREEAAEPSAPLEVGGAVEPPRRLTAPLPAYPDAAWAHGITGDVLVRAVIDEGGAVTDVEVLKSLPYGMTEAAVEAIRRWKFAPATRHGQPVAVYRNLSVRFEG